MCFENSLERLKFFKRCIMINAFELTVNSSVNSSWNKNSISSVLLFSFIILTVETKKIEFVEKLAANNIDRVNWIEAERFTDSSIFFLSSDSVILIWFLYFFLLRVLRWDWKILFSKIVFFVRVCRISASIEICVWIDCEDFVWFAWFWTFWIIDWIKNRKISIVTFCCENFDDDRRWFFVCSFENAVNCEMKRSLRLYRLFNLYEFFIEFLRFFDWFRNNTDAVNLTVCWIWSDVVWIWIESESRFRFDFDWKISSERVFEIISPSSSYFIWCFIVNETWRRRAAKNKIT